MTNIKHIPSLATLAILLYLAGFCSSSVMAQETKQPTPSVQQSPKTDWRKLWELTASVGINIGASTPLPVPTEMTKIYVWYPHLNPRLMALGTYWWNPQSKWGLTVGIGAEYKGMGATTAVKALRVTVPDVSGGLEGKFTGDNSTEIKVAYLTVPVMATMRLLKDQMRISAGLYTSLVMQRKMEVIIDGILTVEKVDRIPQPQPTPMDLELKNFEFSDGIAGYDLGLSFDASYFFSHRIAVSAGLTFGLSSIIKPDFDYIPYRMHNVFAHIGFTYRISD